MQAFTFLPSFCPKFTVLKQNSTRVTFFLDQTCQICDLRRKMINCHRHHCCGACGQATFFGGPCATEARQGAQSQVKADNIGPSLHERTTKGPRGGQSLGGYHFLIRPNPKPGYLQTITFCTPWRWETRGFFFFLQPLAGY